MMKGREVLRCSFCGKSQNEVRKLIAGPGVYICDQCIKICVEMLEEDNILSRSKETGRELTWDKVPKPHKDI